MGQPHGAGEFVYGVAHADIQRLPEYSIARLAQSQNLGVGPADIDHRRITSPGLPLAHLDVGHAVVDAYEGKAEAQAEGPRRRGHCAQARPQPRPLGEGYAVHLQALLPGEADHIAHHLGNVLGVMLGRLPGVDAAFSRNVGGRLLV